MKKLTLTTSYLQECFKQARYYEFCIESDRALTVLEPIWSNIEAAPVLDGLSERDAWEVLLICGSVISAHGSTLQKKHYHELAADMLTRARDMALLIGERELIAESEKQMATAYWRNGQFDNAVAFLKTALGKYSEAEQLTETICLLAQTNLLLLYVKTGQFDIAFETFEKLKPFVDASDDLWLKTGFYNQAAGVVAHSGNFKHAIPLFEKAVQYSTLSKNNTYLGGNLNNLANAYINLPVPEPKKAMSYIDQAINIFLSVSQIYLYAVALETKSQIYAQIGDYKKALVTIDESIRILEKGENYAELAASLWTRVDVLVKTGEKKQAIRQFNELLRLVNDKLSLLAGDEYIEQFSRLFYLPTGRNFEEKESNFRSFLLDEALAKCGGIVTATASCLGIIHQTLSVMLKKFPDLVEKHQVKLRTRSAAKLPNPKAKSAENKVFPDSFVMRLQSDRLKHLGLSKGTKILVTHRSLDELNLLKPVVIQDKDRNYHCGFLVDAFGMFAFDDGQGNIERTFMPSEVIQSGQVTAVYNAETDQFTPFENIQPGRN